MIRIVLIMIALWSAPALALSPASFRICTSEEPGTKERLDCYDRIQPPTPRMGYLKPKTINDCKWLREQDTRMECYDRFMMTLVGTSATSKPAASPRTTSNMIYRAAPTATARTQHRVTSGPCPCGSGRVCVGPRGGRYCMTSGGRKRYGR